MFKDRTEAGKKLAELLKKYQGQAAVVYALPRGGVVVASEIAKALHAPLDLIITRKIGHPLQPEYAIGAVAENGHSILNEGAISDVSEEYLEEEIETQKEEAQRRRKVYLGNRKPILCQGKIAILVDDGIATGLTMKAAIQELKLHYKPEKIVVAVPVAPAETVEELKSKGVEVVAVEIPEYFQGAIGAYYGEFNPVKDEEVINIIMYSIDMVSHDKLLDLSGKTAIVTGGAMGIGFGIAYRLSEAGVAVVIADLDFEKAKESAADLTAKGWKALGIACDISKEEDIRKMTEGTISIFGSIDILVNNAGIYPSIPISKMTFEDFDKVLAINLEGAFLCTRYAAEQMIKQGHGGRIINITSIDALHPSMVGLAHYDSSKHGLWGFTKNAALEYAQHKIWVNAIAPGGIATEGVAKMQKGAPAQKEVIEAFLNKIPMHRMGEADDIGKVALFLASDMSSYMTGSQIVVDGGVLLS